MVIKINYTSSDVYVSTSVSPVYVVVNYSGTSGGGGNFVPYTGATGDVDLGEFALSAGQLTLDTTPTGTAVVGTTRWNDTIGSSETTLKGGNVILKNGVDLVARVVNKVNPNTTLTKAAYQAVRVSGAQGQRLAVALAQANNDTNSADTIGLVTETIATNQEGFIMTMGNLEGINTTGSLQGETWADGDVLYLSPTTAGRLTNIKPTGATGHIVVIGYVEYSHINNGKIYVKIMNGWELDELHNVYITSPTNNDALIYESATSLWKNKTIATALGYTPVPTTRTLTINGTAYDLSADRSWTVSGGGTTIYSGDGTLAGDRIITSNGNSLTIFGGKEEYAGSPVSLRLQGDTTNKSPHFSIKNTNANGFDYTFRSLIDGNFELINYTTLTTILKIKSQYFQITSSANSFLFGVESNTLPGLWIGVDAGSQTLANSTLLKNGNDTILSSNSMIRFYNGTTDTGRIFATTGNWLIQTGGTFTDNGFKLDVKGTARVSGATNQGLKIEPITIFGLPNYASISGQAGGGATTWNFAMSNNGNQTLINAGQRIYLFIEGTQIGAIGEGGSGDLIFQNGGTFTSVASSQFTINSTTKGFLPPRMTTTQKNAISSPAAGLVVYDTTTNKLCCYNGTTWNDLF